MKLELKHIAPYLPYGLKIKLKSELYPDPTIVGFVRDTIWLNYHGTSLHFNIKTIKPILRPLSDLTTPIVMDGILTCCLTELLRNSNFNIDIMSWDNQLEYLDVFLNVDTLVWNDIQILLEWHFDVFGLIPQNLAIDINTLEK